MARIAGVNVPDNKKVPYALRYVKGIGLVTANQICTDLNIDVNSRMSEVDEDTIIRVRNYLEENDILVEGALNSEIRRNIKHHLDLRTYKGLRHRAGLPVRGQKTKTNARTRKGPAKSIAGKKK